MKKTIFFTDRFITFSSSPIENYDLTIDSRADTIATISRAKVVDFFEKYNSLLFLCNTPEEAYANFCSDFHAVTAAGGLVSNNRGQSLMIYRNGRWDLAKGHLESGESLEECAVREVEEETGIDGITLEKKITETLHAYIMRGRWEIKTTHWYSMQSQSDSTKGQSEEGIEEAKWCSPEEVNQNLKLSYPTIRIVFEEAKKL